MEKILIFGNLITIISALVCPIYLPLKFNSSQDLIKNCEKNCSFSNVFEKSSACLGVYYNYSGEIFIKQLSIIYSDKQCLTLKQCILDIDSLNSQSFSCCCSTDNCTLQWKNPPSTTATTLRSILFNNNNKIEENRIKIEENQFSWKLFFTIFLFLMIILLIIFTFILWKSLKTKQEITENKSIIKSPISIEQLFLSSQQLIIGKNNIIYKGTFNNNPVILKAYKQTNMLIWKNEMTLLKSIEHESIIKIISEGQYDSQFYIIFPYYENSTLQTYLRTINRSLSVNQCLVYFRSLASALSYLHLGENKLSMTIVHRDIKSSNILIDKNELKIYLADFSLAMTLPYILTEKDFVQVGTIRYMAPELLEGVIAHTREALCNVDMYALALVMWEIITQCEVYPITVYRPPYDEYITNNSDGSLFATQLYDTVVVRKYRPTLNRELNDKKYASIIHELCLLIEACWTDDSDIRMNAQTLAFKLKQLIL